MSKVTLTSITDFSNENTAVTQINNNFQALQTALENTLSRDGTSPNQMGSSLDMNSQRILNLPAPSHLTDPVRLQDVAAGAVSITGGIPTGGTSGQILIKNSGTDFDAAWTTTIPVATAISGLGTGVATALAVNIGTAGSVVTNGGALGTPTSGTLTNATGLPISTGVSGLATGIATFLATPSSANLRAALTDEVGTGAAYFVSGALGTPASGTLTSCTGLPISTGLTGTGTGVLTALAVNVGTAGAFVVQNGALGTPSSGTLTSCTGLPLSTGVTGNLPVGNLNSGTGASSSTFWRGDGTWASPGGGVTSVNGATGALVSYFPPQGRITLASGVPVMATSQSGCTTVYYTPYQGNMVPIYDGTNMVPTAVAEISQATTDTTKSPAAVAASKFYDLFVWNDSGTIRCTRGPAWTNATTRGYTLTMVNGILLNTSSIFNGPAAQRGTWVGCIGSNGSSTIDWTLGAAGSGGVAALLNVYNAYNRVLIGTTVTDTSATHTYTSSTIRQWGGGSGMQVTFLSGATEDAFVCQVNGQGSTVAASSASASFGIGYDATNAFTVQNFLIFNFTAAAILTGGGVNMQKSDFGQHFFSFNEKSDGTNANNFNNASLANLTFTGRM